MGMIEDDPDYWEYHGLLWEAELAGEVGAPPLTEDKTWWLLNANMWEQGE